jgi:hypothetical protein
MKFDVLSKFIHKLQFILLQEGAVQSTKNTIKHFIQYICILFTLLLGFPKVLPTPGTIPPPQQLIPQGSLRRQSSRGLECLQPPQRSGSFRQRTSPVNATPPEKPPLAFCRRRSSWPEIDPRATSG